METITITRTGLPPIVFAGQVVAVSVGRLSAGQETNRWHDLTVYRTSGGRYVCRIEYITQWQGELGHTEAEAVDAGDIAAWFREYSPVDHVQGFPAAPAYAERQAHLLEWIRRRYDHQVGELLAALGDVTAERVE